MDKVKETLEKQLELLSERSHEDGILVEELCKLSREMSQIAVILNNP